MNFGRHLSASALEARAGLISEADYLEVEKLARIARTKRVVRTVKAYAKLKICRSDHAAIANILADLRHYCEAQSLSFSEINKEGWLLYEEEKDIEIELNCC